MQSFDTFDINIDIESNRSESSQDRTSRNQRHRAREKKQNGEIVENIESKQTAADIYTYTYTHTNTYRYNTHINIYI